MDLDLKALARKMVAVLNFLVACFAGIYFLVRHFEIEFLSKQMPTDAAPALAGAFVLFMNSLRLLYWRAGRRKEVEGPILSHTPEGVVQVSREALESGLRNVGEQLDEVTRLRVKVLAPQKKKVLIRAHYLAPEGVQILDLSSKLRKVLKDRFKQLVCMHHESGLEFEIIFEGFYGKARVRPQSVPGKEPTPEAPPPEEESPPPFTGIRYPIDNSGEVNP